MAYDTRGVSRHTSQPGQINSVQHTLLVFSERTKRLEILFVACGWAYIDTNSNNSFIITSHTVSVWLTVTLAVFRYIAVCHHAIARRICTLHRARVAAACIVVAAVVVCLPTYLTYQPSQISFNIAPFVSNGNKSNFGFGRGYDVEIPENLSMTLLVDSKIHGTAGGSGYWFEEKEFVGPTFQSVNFWVYEFPEEILPYRKRNRKYTCRFWSYFNLCLHLPRGVLLIVASDALRGLTSGYMEWH